MLGANDEDNYEKDRGDDGDVDMAASAGGVSAYVEAITGKDAYKRGQRNRVKFSNKRSRDDEGDEDMGDDHTDGAASGGYSSGGKRAKIGKSGKGPGVKGVKEGRVRKGHKKGGASR